MTVVVGIPIESREGETRVAMLPETIARISAAKGGVEPPFRFLIERSAGASAFTSDAEYEAVGGEIVEGEALWPRADVVITINPPQPAFVGRMREHSVLLGMLRPFERLDLMRVCVERRITAFSFESAPRITRAQKVDVLSSMSTVAGYRAVLLGAELCPRFMPMLMTAAGTITPARVLVIGAGVAGLQAIATARRLGAIVEGYDIRPAAREQILSLGARFVELPLVTADAETAEGYAKEQTADQQRRQRELLADHIAGSDVVITTALVPGKPAPRILDDAAVERMRPGAVIVDLAAEAGGNCSRTVPGETITTRNSVRIAGPLNLPAELPVHASQMYGRNAAEFLKELAPEGELVINLDDDMIGPMCMTHDGEVCHQSVRSAMGLPVREEMEAS